MMLYQHLLTYTCLVSMATWVLAGDHKIDFRCHSDFNSDALNNLKEDCKLKTGNPLKRPCVDACVLHDLGLLRKAFNSSKSNLWDSGQGPTLASVELEDLFSDNQDLAEAIQKNVEAKCTDIMLRTIKEEKKTCEDWDAIFVCIKDAVKCVPCIVNNSDHEYNVIPAFGPTRGGWPVQNLHGLRKYHGNACECGATIQKIDTIFPDLRCHPGYKRGPSREDHLQCRREIESPFDKNCYKACMLQRLGVFEYTMIDEKEAVSRLGEVGNTDDGYSGGMVGELQWRFKGNEELGVQLAKNIVEKCSDTFKNVVIDEKKPCELWDPLYDCIKKAVACKTS